MIKSYEKSLLIKCKSTSALGDQYNSLAEARVTEIHTRSWIYVQWKTFFIRIKRFLRGIQECKELSFFGVWKINNKFVFFPKTTQKRLLAFLDFPRKMINSYKKVFRSNINSGPCGVNAAIPGHGSPSLYRSTTIHTCVLGQNSHKSSPFPSKTRAGFAENGEVGLGNYPLFQSQTSWTFLINQCWLWIVKCWSTITHTCLLGENSNTTSPFSFKMGTCLT